MGRVKDIVIELDDINKKITFLDNEIEIYEKEINNRSTGKTYTDYVVLGRMYKDLGNLKERRLFLKRFM